MRGSSRVFEAAHTISRPARPAAEWACGQSGGAGGLQRRGIRFLQTGRGRSLGAADLLGDAALFGRLEPAPGQAQQFEMDLIGRLGLGPRQPGGGPGNPGLEFGFPAANGIMLQAPHCECCGGDSAVLERRTEIITAPRSVLLLGGAVQRRRLLYAWRFSQFFIVQFY